VVRVARERDDVCAIGGRCAGRWTSRNGSVSPISPARAIEDVRVRATDRLPAATPGSVPLIAAIHADRASDGFGWKALIKRRPPRELHRNESAPAENRKGAASHPQSAGSRMRTRARAGGRMKRRSGIVRRLAAPDSASAASERCRGRKPQERRSTMEPAPVLWHAKCRHRQGQVGPDVRKLRVALVVLCARRLIRCGRAVAGAGCRSARKSRSDAAAKPDAQQRVSVRRRQLENTPAKANKRRRTCRVKKVTCDDGEGARVSGQSIGDDSMAARHGSKTSEEAQQHE